MLVYNKAYDLYHTMFRILQIIEKSKIVLEIDKLRILDFYLAFPVELLEIRAFPGFRKYEEFLNAERNTYERIIDRKRLFYKMEPIQISAIRALISYGLIDPIEYKRGVVKRTGESLSEALRNRINEANKDAIHLIDRKSVV